MTYIPQLLVNGIIAGSIYALVAAGFSLIYYVIKFLDFSSGAILTVSAYLFFTFLKLAGLNFFVALILSIFFSTITGYLINKAVYRTLRKRKASNIVLLIVSLSLLTFFTSLILAVFGSGTKTLITGQENIVYDAGLFRITLVQLNAIIISVLLFILLVYLMKRTRLGKSMRALADNKDVSQIVGINPEKIFGITFIIASLFSSIAGIIAGLDQAIHPNLGFSLIIKGFISAIIGGVNYLPGAIAGGFFVGLVENLGIAFLPSAYKNAISFVLLLVFLLLRPQGLFGFKVSRN